MLVRWNTLSPGFWMVAFAAINCGAVDEKICFCFEYTFICFTFPRDSLAKAI